MFPGIFCKLKDGSYRILPHQAVYSKEGPENRVSMLFSTNITMVDLIATSMTKYFTTIKDAEAFDESKSICEIFGMKEYLEKKEKNQL